MIEPPFAAFDAAHSAGRAQLVWSRRIADTETPVSAMLKLGGEGSGAFILESVEGGSVRGRYSLLGFMPDLVFRACGQKAEVNRRVAKDRDAFEMMPEGPLGALRRLVAETRMELPAELPPAFAGFVGYMGYETVGLVEPVAVPAHDPLQLPDMLFVRPSLILVFDRLQDELFIAAPVYPDGSDTRTAYAAAAERIETAEARLAAPLPSTRPSVPTDFAGITPHTPTGQYAAMVARAKDYIRAGDIFQVVLAQRFSTPFPLPPMSLYRSLRRINPSPFLYLLDLPGFALIGSSPEILVRVRGGEVTVRPIAGTRPRGGSALEDAANRDSLLADPKELAEHLMLLDLGRNDVGRVAAEGSVAVTERNSVEFYSHVMHIVSNVRGELAPGKDAIDALMAGFPAGTVSGAPKVRAMQIIAELEAEKRGAYAGGVGYFSPDGSMDSCIVLRTAVVKDGIMHIQAGAGIVADSDPAYEQRECEAKAGALVAAARDALSRTADAGYGQ
jgi:anthranilate synthase component 1